MTKKDLWDYEFSKPKIMTRDYQHGNCSICNQDNDIRFMKGFRCFEEEEFKYICKDCFLK